MTKKEETVKVYWAPQAFTKSEEQWNMFYRDPVPVADSFYSNLSSNPAIVRCPVTRNSMKNLFSLNSNVQDSIELNKDLMQRLYDDQSDSVYSLPVNSKIALKRARPSSYDNFVNFEYNLAWIFFCDEPLTMRITPPLFPVSMPAKDSILSFGKLDIGRYFRSIRLDYHIPKNSSSFIIKEGQPLLFLEFETDKRIEFVRFANTDLLKNLAKEFWDSPSRIGKNIPLIKRYETVKHSNILKIVASEIKKNIIE